MIERTHSPSCAITAMHPLIYICLGTRISVAKTSTGETTDIDIIGDSTKASRAKELIEEVVQRVQMQTASRQASPSSGAQTIKIAKTDPINKSNIEKELWFMFEDLELK